MKEMPTNDVLPDVLEEPNCRVAQPANVVISANTKAYDSLAKDASIPTKPTKKDEALPHQTNLPDHYKNYGKRAVES